MGGQGLTWAGFHVEPDAVAALGRLVGRAGEGAQSYLDKALPESHDLLGQIGSELKEGILLNIWPALDRCQELGRSSTQRGAVLGTMGGASLVQAATFYRHVDNFEAARLDSAYGIGLAYERLPQQELGRGPDKAFTDRELIAPYRPLAEDTLEDELLYDQEKLLGEVDKLTGLTSLYGQYRALIKDIIGRDPIEEAIRLVTGDWRVVFQESHAFTSTGKAFDTIRTNIDQGRFDIQDRWTGIAGSRALAWLGTYSAACGQHAAYMQEVGKEIKLFARGMYHQFVALNSALDAAVDSVITAALAVAGKPTWTVPFFGGVTALFRGENEWAVLLSFIIAQFQKVAEVIGNISLAVHAFIGIMETLGGGIGDAALASWPTAPYDHPAC